LFSEVDTSVPVSELRIVHDAAFVVDHETVEESLYAIDAGDQEMLLMTAALAEQLSVHVPEFEPPFEPLQVHEYVPLLNAPSPA
jgi:hypothetical protein